MALAKPSLPGYVYYIRVRRRPTRGWGRASQPFVLGRETRRSYPLSPYCFPLPKSLWWLRLELVEDFRYGALHETILLYADDMLLLMGDMGSLLRTVMEIAALHHHAPIPLMKPCDCGITRKGWNRWCRMHHKKVGQNVTWPEINRENSDF